MHRPNLQYSPQGRAGKNLSAITVLPQQHAPLKCYQPLVAGKACGSGFGAGLVDTGVARKEAEGLNSNYKYMYISKDTINCWYCKRCQIWR